MGSKWDVSSGGDLKLLGVIQDQAGNSSVDVNNHKLIANDGTTFNIDYGVAGVIDFGNASLTNISSISPSIPTQPFWQIVNSVSQSMQINNGYASNTVGLCTLTLPILADVGAEIKVTALSLGGFYIAQNAGQQIRFGNQVSASGITGGISSTSIGDSVYLVCLIQDTLFQCIAPVGNINIF